jgi:hypothetical protein
MSGHNLPFSPPAVLVRTTPPGRDTSKIIQRIRACIGFGDLDARVVVQIEVVQRATL